MGGNICKSCDNFSKFEEMNLSGINNDKQNYINPIYQNSKSVIPTIKKKPTPLLNNDFMKTTIVKTTIKNDDIGPMSPKVEVDEREINKIIYNYKIRLIISLFRKLKKLKEETGMAVLFISHDIKMLSKYADKMVVMYCGHIIEEANIYYKIPTCNFDLYN